MRATLLTALVLSVLIVTPTAFAEQFKDVPKDHWAADYVQIVAADGVMKGYPDTTFKGDKPVTRYELAVALERMIAYIEGSLKPEVEKQGIGSREQGIEGMPSPQPSVESGKSKVESPKAPSLPGEGATTPLALSRPEAVSKGDPARALKDGGFIAADSPLLKDAGKTVSPTELAQALSSVATRLIEKYIPPPKD